MSPFFRYDLRTTDLIGARAFYSHVLGSQVWDAGLTVSPLPERAAAAGAPAHWLGHVRAHDVEKTTARMIDVGAQQLGPIQRGPDGTSCAVLRDPFGAVLALSSETGRSRPTIAVWHVSHTKDHDQAFAWYAGLLGWTSVELLELGPEKHRHQVFAWGDSRESVGTMASTAKLPHVHSQWLFFFPVSSVEDSLVKVRAHGGQVLGSGSQRLGRLVAAPCEDPQGAAFGVYRFADTVP